MTARLLRGHRPARTWPSRRRAAGDRDDRWDRRPDCRPGRVRPRLRVRRRRLLPRPQLRRLRQALQPPPRGHGPGRGGRLGLAQGGPARLRPLEGAQGGRGHVLGLALGPGPARLAHRVLGDGRAGARRLPSRSTAAAPTLSSPTTRTRSPSRRRPGRPFARAWMHNGMVETDAEKMSKSEGNIFQLSEALDRYGREAVVAYLISGHYRQPLAFGPEQMEQAVARSSGCGISSGCIGGGGLGGGLAGATAGRLRRDPPRAPRRRRAFREALADDFNTPRALAEALRTGRGSQSRARSGRARAVRRDA